MPPRRRQTSRCKSGKRSSQRPAPTNPTPRVLPPHSAPQQPLPPRPPTPPLRRSSRQSTIASSTRLYIKLPPTVPASGQLSTVDSEDSDDGGDGDDGDDEDDDEKSDFNDEDNKELRKMVLEYSPRPFHRNMKLCEDGLADLKAKAAEGSVALEEHLRPYPKDEGGYTKTYFERGLWIAVEIPQSVWRSPKPFPEEGHWKKLDRKARHLTSIHEMWGFCGVCGVWHQLESRTVDRHLETKTHKETLQKICGCKLNLPPVISLSCSVPGYTRVYRPDVKAKIEREHASKCAREAKMSIESPVVELAVQGPPPTHDTHRAPEDTAIDRRGRKRSRTGDGEGFSPSGSRLDFDGPAAVPLANKRSGPDSDGPPRAKRQRTAGNSPTPSTESPSPGPLTPPPPFVSALPPCIVSPPAAATPSMSRRQRRPKTAQACANPTVPITPPCLPQIYHQPLTAPCAVVPLHSHYGTYDYNNQDRNRACTSQTNDPANKRLQVLSRTTAPAQPSPPFHVVQYYAPRKSTQPTLPPRDARPMSSTVPPPSQVQRAVDPSPAFMHPSVPVYAATDTIQASHPPSQEPAAVSASLTPPADHTVVGQANVPVKEPTGDAVDKREKSPQIPLPTISHEDSLDLFDLIHVEACC